MTSGYNSEPDSLTLKLDENTVPPLSKQVYLNNEDEVGGCACVGDAFM